MCLKYFVKAYKSSKVHAYIALEVTMTLILKMESFKCFVNQKVYTIIYRHRELLNKMGLWNEEHNTQGDARIMLFESSIPKYFWSEAVNTSCYVQNKILIRPILERTSL